MNQPVEIQLPQGKIYYLYNATGKRIQKRIQPHQGAVVTTDYFGEFQYENGVLQFFAHPEGYVKPHNSGYLYVYQYKDHLDNVRLSYADVNDNGVIEPNSEILEESNYYPFGLKHQGYNEITNINKNIAAEKYKFGDKEWNDELGLNLYDFHARNYDAAIGRTTTYDPMAEEFYSLSPQSFLNNNPINFVDPTGMVAFPADSYGRNLLMTGAAFNFSYFGDGWIKSTNDNGTDTYTYDATITSQKEVDTFLPGKEYMGENFDLIGTHIRTNQKAYHYEFKGNKVYKNGKLLDLTNNHTTKGGSMVMNPEKRGGEFTEFSLGGAAGGGIGLAFGVVRDNFGESSFYFTFSGYAGLGGGLGINSGVISPTNNQTFSVNDFSGNGNSITGNLSVGPASFGVEYGGTQGKDFSDFGNATLSNQRSYMYYEGGQSSQYPGVGVGIGKISGGVLISSSRTWLLK